MYLGYVSGHLNPADCLSRIDSKRGGPVASTCEDSRIRFEALDAYPDVPSPVWALGFPKGRRGAAANLKNSPLGSAEQSHQQFFA